MMTLVFIMKKAPRLNLDVGSLSWGSFTILVDMNRINDRLIIFLILFSNHNTNYRYKYDYL